MVPILEATTVGDSESQGVSLYSTVQYSTVQYSTVQYSTVQYSTAQYSTVPILLVLLGGAVHCTAGAAVLVSEAALSEVESDPAACLDSSSSSSSSSSCGHPPC